MQQVACLTCGAWQCCAVLRCAVLQPLALPLSCFTAMGVAQCYGGLDDQPYLRLQPLEHTVASCSSRALSCDTSSTGAVQGAAGCRREAQEWMRTTGRSSIARPSLAELVVATPSHCMLIACTGRGPGSSPLSICSTLRFESPRSTSHKAVSARQPRSDSPTGSLACTACSID
jgi:hypothetical protein